jgi:hypothetical protein
MAGHANPGEPRAQGVRDRQSKRYVLFGTKNFVAKMLVLFHAKSMEESGDIELARKLTRRAIAICDELGDKMSAVALQAALDRLEGHGARVREPRRPWGLDEPVVPQADPVPTGKNKVIDEFDPD